MDNAVFGATRPAGANAINYIIKYY